MLFCWNSGFPSFLWHFRCIPLLQRFCSQHVKNVLYLDCAHTEHYRTKPLYYYVQTKMGLYKHFHKFLATMIATFNRTASTPWLIYRVRISTTIQGALAVWWKHLIKVPGWRPRKSCLLSNMALLNRTDTWTDVRKSPCKHWKQCVLFVFGRHLSLAKTLDTHMMCNFTVYYPS